MSIPNLVKDLGPIDEWLIPVEEIEHSAEGMCEHLKALWDCQPCLVGRLFVRQMELIGERIGLSPEDAAELARSYPRPGGAR
jgi:hypothetical protein